MSSNTVKKVREPLIHIAKRTDIKGWQKILIYGGGIIMGLIISSLVCAAASEDGDTPLDFFSQLIYGCFGTSFSIEELIRDTFLLLGVCLALIPVFKMKYWNLGGNGQILIGALVSIIIMYELGGKVPDPVINVLTVVASIAAGAIWAGLPAVFKAFFDTNESLFTLMMNYIATTLVAVYINATVKTQSGTFPTLTNGLLPVLGNPIVLPVIVITVLMVGMFFYLGYSKHGFELALVGESKNTARYVGINVKKVIIRTVVLSGAVCGLIGMLLVTTVTPSITADTAKNMGFTAIMSTWLGNFDPFIILASSFIIIFSQVGMRQVQVYFHFTTTAIVDFVLGIIYFAIIACEFFINFKIHFRRKEKKAKPVNPPPSPGDSGTAKKEVQ